LIQKGVLVPGDVARPFRDGSVGGPECGQNLAGVTGIEEIDECCVLTLNQFDFQVCHEPADGQPEIIPHHQDRLHMLTIAMSQSSDQLRVLLATLGMEPLLELVQYQ